MLPFPMLAANPTPTSKSAVVSDSAFSSPNLSPFNSDPSPHNLVSFVDAFDAASRISPLSATLTKNTRGWGHILQAKSSLSVVLANRHSLLFTISFRIRTSAKHTRNLFTMNTSKTQDLKLFRMNTYEKTGEGVRRGLKISRSTLVTSPSRETFFLPPGCSPQVQENLDAASRPSRLRPSSLNIPAGTAPSPRADHISTTESPLCPRKLSRSPHLPQFPNAAFILASLRKPPSLLISAKTNRKTRSSSMSAKTASSFRRPIACHPISSLDSPSRSRGFPSPFR